MKIYISPYKSVLFMPWGFNALVHQRVERMKIQTWGMQVWRKWIFCNRLQRCLLSTWHWWMKQDTEPCSSREMGLLSVGGHTQDLLTRRSAVKTLGGRGWKKKTRSCCMNNVSEDWILRAAAVRLTRTVETAAWLRCAQSFRGTNRKRNNKKRAKCAWGRELKLDF